MENDFNLEELDDLDLDSETSYEVWATGYDLYNKPTAHDYLLDSFSDPDLAVTFADSITVSEIMKVTDLTLGGTERFSIEVETVSLVDDEPMNLGTIYRRTIYYNSITADVAITSSDYTLLEDGSLMIHFNKLHKFKNKETINVLFADEPNQPILTIKIIGECYGEPHENYFVCEIVF
jgi:hypothetical protein